MVNFITIDLDASGVQISGNIHVIGLPTLNAIDGFAHNISREFDLPVQGWAIAYRKCEVLDGHPMVVNYELGHKGKKETTPYILDRRQARIGAVLFLDLGDENSLSKSEVTESLESRVEALRFSGGTFIIGKAGIRSWDSIEPAMEHVAKSYVEPHFLLEDQSELLNHPPEGLGRLDWLLDLVARPKDYQGEDTTYAYEGPYKGYLAPVVKGYKLLEKPRPRKDVRHDYLHAYAEPIIGVARMRNLVSVLSHMSTNDEDDALRVFWAGFIDADFESDEYELISYSPK